MQTLSLLPCSVGSLDWRGDRGERRTTVVVKRTYLLQAGLPLADAQEPVYDSDQSASLEDSHVEGVDRPRDLIPFKRRVDCVVVGSAFGFDDDDAGVDLDVALRLADRIEKHLRLPPGSPLPRANGGGEVRATKIGLGRPLSFGPIDATERGGYQCAPSDQQVDELLPGDFLELDYLHPEESRLVLPLPVAGPVAFVFDDAKDPRLLTLKTDTIVVDTDHRILTMASRASFAPTRQDVLVVIASAQAAAAHPRDILGALEASPTSGPWLRHWIARRARQSNHGDGDRISPLLGSGLSPQPTPPATAAPVSPSPPPVSSKPLAAPLPRPAPPSPPPPKPSVEVSGTTPSTAPILKIGGGGRPPRMTRQLAGVVVAPEDQAPAWLVGALPKLQQTQFQPPQSWSTDIAPHAEPEQQATLVLEMPEDGYNEDDPPASSHDGEVTVRGGQSPASSAARAPALTAIPPLPPAPQMRSNSTEASKGSPAATALPVAPVGPAPPAAPAPAAMAVPAPAPVSPPAAPVESEVHSPTVWNTPTRAVPVELVRAPSAAPTIDSKFLDQKESAAVPTYMKSQVNHRPATQAGHDGSAARGGVVAASNAAVDGGWAPGVSASKAGPAVPTSHHLIDVLYVDERSLRDPKVVEELEALRDDVSVGVARAKKKKEEDEDVALLWAKPEKSGDTRGLAQDALVAARDTPLAQVGFRAQEPGRVAALHADLARVSGVFQPKLSHAEVVRTMLRVASLALADDAKVAELMGLLQAIDDDLDYAPESVFSTVVERIDRCCDGLEGRPSLTEVRTRAEDTVLMKRGFSRSVLRDVTYVRGTIAYGSTTMPLYVPESFHATLPNHARWNAVALVRPVISQDARELGQMVLVGAAVGRLVDPTMLVCRPKEDLAR